MDGLHEGLISEEVWEQAQIKAASQAKKYEKVNSVKGEKTHLLSGLLKCPVCGTGMMKQKINMEVDTSALDQEIANYEKQLRQCYANKDNILADLDGQDYDDSIINEEKRI